MRGGYLVWTRRGWSPAESYPRGRFKSPPPEQTEVDARIDATALLDALPPRERAVLRLRFGIHQGQTMTLDEVGQALKVSRERARQIQDAAVERLRKVAR